MKKKINIQSSDQTLDTEGYVIYDNGIIKQWGIVTLEYDTSGKMLLSKKLKFKIPYTKAVHTYCFTPDCVMQGDNMPVFVNILVPMTKITNDDMIVIGVTNVTPSIIKSVNVNYWIKGV